MIVLSVHSRPHVPYLILASFVAPRVRGGVFRHPARATSRSAIRSRITLLIVEPLTRTFARKVLASSSVSLKLWTRPRGSLVLGLPTLAFAFISSSPSVALARR